MDLIKCPDCGEMYSPSYPRCPFCEEDGARPRRIARTSQHRVAGKQQAQSARGGLIVVLILVLALMSWYLFSDRILHRGDMPDGADGTETVEPNVPAIGTTADPFYQEPPSGGQPGGTTTQPESDPEPTGGAEPVIGVNVDVSNAKLNREDFTLSGVGDSFRVQVSGTEAAPTWSIDNANVASIASDGTVKAVANGSTTLRCKVGTRELTCVVRVRNTNKTAEPASAPTTAAPSTGATTAAPAAPSTGTAHVDASALTVKTNYGTTLQKDPGTGYPDCTVVIGGDPITLKIVGTDVPASSWTSDKTSVVEISNDGKLTPVGAGTAHVIATVGDAKITCIIRVR